MVVRPERADIISGILRRLCDYETMFTDYQRGEDRMTAVMRVLSNPTSMVWEVWKKENAIPVDVVGILYLTRISYGLDAVAHYVFFDGNLRSKTELMRRVLEWVFTDHENWKALQRLTLHVPEYAFALARHAQKHLGFGGSFRHTVKGKSLLVEGVKEDAILWRGTKHPMLIMGIINGRLS